ncbi:probable ADP-ribosylation factor GTPase-activating protein AGD14 isoform X2 [Aristolochia californica]|uniref:probable ADP-ribosylation factor GTPase-activating protein AGD14 isoform X2 n=1 Tax=Aristolochia californica TaxID=171875 RepID=UPI0035DE5F05
MASRMKEDEKNEKIIRGLLKLPANRRCINCSSLGPQYVCTNFWTFVCTTCSGIHREFTHRVKSISMAKFTTQEVNALQTGGNERARETFFKEWDPQRHYVPDSSNIERLRDFIKHVYVDRRYTGERDAERPPRVRMGDREDSYGDIRRFDTFRGASRSPQYEDTYARRYNDKNRHDYDERRSPGYDQEYKRSPVRFEIVDDRVREDRFRNGPQNRRFEDRQFPDGSPKPVVRSPNNQKEMDLPSPPMVRPVRDILGEDVPPLRVGEPPKANGERVSDGPARTQRTASSSSLGSTEGNQTELKRVNSGSLIDFNADPETPAATAATNDLFSGQPAQQPLAAPQSSSDGSNWASFGLNTEDKAAAAPLNSSNTLESQLSQLSAPAPGPVSPMSVGGVVQKVPPNTNNTFESVFSQLSVPAAPAAPPVGQMPSLSMPQQQLQLQQPSLFPTADGQSTFQQFAPAAGAPTTQSAFQLFTSPAGGALGNQYWSAPLASSAQGLAVVPPPGQPSQAAPKQLQGTSGFLSQPAAPTEEKASGRKALPEDLFTSSYAPSHVPIQRWLAAPPNAMGYGMHYPAAMLQTVPTFPQPSKSTNPFDVSTDPAPAQAPMFPSMAPLQGALPNITASSPIMHTPSFGSPSPQWVTSQSPSYQSVVLPGAYMVQQTPSSMSQLGPPGVGSFGSGGTAIGAAGVGIQPAAGFQQPSTPNSFPLGGNPFG